MDQESAEQQPLPEGTQENLFKPLVEELDRKNKELGGNLFLPVADGVWVFKQSFIKLGKPVYEEGSSVMPIPLEGMIRGGIMADKGPFLWGNGNNTEAFNFINSITTRSIPISENELKAKMQELKFDPDNDLKLLQDDRDLRDWKGLFETSVLRATKEQEVQQKKSEETDKKKQFQEKLPKSVLDIVTDKKDSPA